MLGGVKELSRIKKHHLRFETDEGILEDDYIFGAICNSTSLGGTLKLDPNAVDMQDGKFELLLVRAPKNAGELAGFLKAIRRKQYNCAMTTFLNTANVTVTAPADMCWTIDGEREEGHSEIKVMNLQRAIQVITGGSEK